MTGLPNRLSNSSRRPAPSSDRHALIAPPLIDKVFGVLVSAVTFRRASILLLQRSMDEKFMPGAWSIPAGKIQPWESSLEEAALRELREEAGIEGEVFKSLGMSWFESKYYDQQLHHIQFNFAVNAPEGNVYLADKSNMDFLWLPIDQVDRPPVEIDEFTLDVVFRAVNAFDLEC